MDGLLLVDKPKGWTSFDVVAKVRGIIRADRKKQGLPGKVKVGHTGTLDPLATGLLVLAIGSYTKRVPELTKQDKSYETSMRLGFTSTTDDAEGELTKVNDRVPTLDEVVAVLESFIGTFEQVPPQFSAIKIDGVKSYDAARRGETVTFKPRTVTIHRIDTIMYVYPDISFSVDVASGTYIRSLARDAGERLGTGAYLTDLRRTSVSDFKVGDAVKVEDLTIDVITASLIKL